MQSFDIDRSSEIIVFDDDIKWDYIGKNTIDELIFSETAEHQVAVLIKASLYSNEHEACEPFINNAMQACTRSQENICKQAVNYNARLTNCSLIKTDKPGELNSSFSCLYEESMRECLNVKQLLRCWHLMIFRYKYVLGSVSL